MKKFPNAEIHCLLGRQLVEKITDKKFTIGNFSFTDCGMFQNKCYINPKTCSET